MSRNLDVTPDGGATGFACEPGATLFVGRIESVVGACTLVRPGELPVEIKIGDPVCQDHIIETSAGGRVGIRFIDGTVFNLSDRARLAVKEFTTGASPNALFDVSNGTFAFIAGQMAKAGHLGIETPFGKIRGRSGAGGIGMLSLVSLFFAALENAKADDSNVSHLDDGQINYQETQDFRDAPVGTIELIIPATATEPEQHIMLGDASESIIIRKLTNSTVVSYVQNSLSEMLRFGNAANDAIHLYSIGQSGPAGFGNGGSSTPPPTGGPPPFVLPINFIPSGPNGAGPNSGSGGTGNGGTGGISDPLPVQLPPPPKAGPGEIVETFPSTNNPDPNTTTGPVPVPGVTVGAPTFAWSNGLLTDPGVTPAAALAAASTLTVNGPVFTYTIDHDNLVDFLAAGETLTVTYSTTINGSPSQPIVVTIVGTNDQPVIVAGAASGVTEQVHQTSQPVAVTDEKSGTLQFTDVDFNDTHQVAVTLSTATPPTWSPHGTVPTQEMTAIVNSLTTSMANALTASIQAGDDSTGTADHTGTIHWTFSASDKNFDFLAAGETLTLTYNVLVTDDSGVALADSALKTITVVITGTNDQPVITAGATAAITEQAHQTNQPAAITDDASGTLAFTDVDLTDTHTVSSTVGSAIWSGGNSLPSDLNNTTLANAFTVGMQTGDDSTGGATGTIHWAFSLPDKDFDFLADGETLTLTYNVVVTDNSSTDNAASAVKTVVVTITGTNDQPVITSTDGQLSNSITETADQTANPADIHSVGGVVNYTDADLTDVDQINHGDATAVWIDRDGNSHDITDPAIIAAAELTFSPVDQDANSATWTYKVADGALDFLREGETLTVTYTITVKDDSGTDNDTSTTRDIVITITGTNDQPVIEADDTGGITEQVHQTSLADTDDTSGTLNFTDVDLTDKHTVSVELSAANPPLWSASGGTIPAQTLTDVATALTAEVDTDSTGTGSGTINWAFSLPDKDFDFLAAGETLTLTYNVIVTDDSNGDNPSSEIKTVTITITGTNDQPVIAASATAGITEQLHQTNLPDATTDDTSGTMNFTDVDLTDKHTVDRSLASAVWSDGTTLPSYLTNSLLTNAFSVKILSGNDSTGTGGGTVSWAFSLPDKDFDFLAAGETLTLTYNVIVTDDSSTDNNASEVKTVTITVTGTNDQPVIAANATATLTEQVHQTNLADADHTSGNLNFTDVDLTDKHGVSVELSATNPPLWSASGGTIPAQTLSDLATALTAQVATDSNGTGSGTVHWDFNLPDKDFDFLADGETLKLTYNVIVTDDSNTDNASSTIKTVTITVTGTNDKPVIDAPSAGDVFELPNQTNVSTPDTGAGTLGFHDADLTDTHTVTDSFVSAVLSTGGSLPAGLSNLLANALTVGISSGDDSTGDGSGTVHWNFSLPDKNFDFLNNGDTITVTYNVTVKDDSGTDNASSVTQPVTITIHGTNDKPVVTLGSGAYSLDQFNTFDYGVWKEQNDDFNAVNGSPTSGEFQIAHDPTTAAGNLQIRLTDLDEEVGAPDLVSRSFNLSGATSATLTFDYRRDIPDGETNDQFFVQISNDGGATFKTIGQIGATGNGSFVDGSYKTFTYNLLSSEITSNTIVRFSVGDDVDDGDVVYVDNVKMAYTTGSSSPNIAVNFTENSAVGLSAAVTDVDDTQMSGAAITITNAKGGDYLSISNLAALAALGITVAPGSDATHLNLTGTASKSAYASALGLVVFSNTGDNPDTTDRTVTVTVTDAHGGVSDPATVTVHVTAVDDAPVIWAPSSIAFAGNAQTSDVPLNVLKFSDVDTTGPVTVTISSDDSSMDIHATSSGGVTVTGAGDDNVTFTGTIADLNAYFAANHATLQLNDSSADTLTITINDGAGGIDTQVITGYNANNPSFTSGNNSFSFPGNNIFNVNTTSFDAGGGNDTIVTAWNHINATATTYTGGSGTDTITAVFSADQLDDVLNSSFSTVRNFYDGSPNSGMNLANTSWHAIVSTDWETAKLGLAAPRAPDNFIALDTWSGVIGTGNVVATDGTSGATFAGTSGNDVIIGGATGQTLNGGAGNDVLAAFHTGPNTLNGGDGNDLLLGGTGNDTLSGGLGNDVIAGGAGADTIVWGTEPLSSANADLVVGYDYTEGDKINLQSLVPSITNGSASDYVHIVGSGNNLLVQVDTDGTANGANFTTAYTLLGANTDGADLVRVAIGGQNFVMSDSGGVSPAADPIVLDLGAPGISFTSMANGVSFDINGDGVADHVAWTTGNDGFLAYDVNGNGTIDNGNELFTPNFAGGHFASGLAALASLDSNGDGVIDAADAAYAKLEVWQDTNHNGIADAGELSSLADNGITAVNLDGTPDNGTVDGQQLQAQGTFTNADGTTGSFVEVALDTSLGTSPGANAESPSSSTFTAGDDTIYATAGGVLTGGGGNDTFVFKSVADSAPGDGQSDTITDFTHNSDHIDLSQILGLANIQGQVASANTVDANSISWFVDSEHNQTVVYVNTTTTANHVDMEIHLTGTNINLTGSDILHHA